MGARRPTLRRRRGLMQESRHGFACVGARHAADSGRETGKAARFGNAQADQGNDVRGQPALQDVDTQAPQACLERCAGGDILLQVDVGDVALEDSGEQRLLSGNRA